MTPWRVIVPIKAAIERKHRLADSLSSAERVELSDAMLWHVLDVLRNSACIGEIVLLSMTPIAGWHGSRIADEGRGLNAELQVAAATRRGPLLVIHADLPKLSVEDVAALIQAGEDRIAIAPDRHRQGTNALALGRPDRFLFSFGVGSMKRHLRQHPDAAIVQRLGLELDIDVAEDLALLGEHGSGWPTLSVASIAFSTP
jgi:2-phospho-L-lactate guanylyltransferase